MTTWGLLAAICLGAPSVAGAQDEGVSGQLEAAAQASPKEMVAFAKSALAEMDSAGKSVGKMLEQAVKDGEADKQQCLRSKNASIRALTEVSNQASNAMQEALAANEDERARHEYRKVAVALQKVRQFMAEAESCLGESGVAPGTTSVDVTGGPEETADDETEDQFKDSFVAIDPPRVSPFE